MENLRKLRKQKGLTMKQFGEIIGVAESTISLYETGNREPDKYTLFKLADYFGVTTDYLLGRTDNPTVEKVPDNLIPFTPDEIIIFPIIGTIAAGYNGVAEYNPTGEEIPIPKYLLKSHNPDDYFVLQVKGHSMQPLYKDGDKVLIRKCDSVDSGKIAAVGYNSDDATLKKVEYVKGEDWMKLIPLNPDYPTVTITKGDLEQCRIYGEVIYIFSEKTQIKNELEYLGIGNSDRETLELLKKIKNLTTEQKNLLMSMINNMIPQKK